MHEALLALNQIVADGVIETYAVGGAMGAMFYIDAFETQDLDVFVLLPPTGVLLSLTPIYDALKAQGGVVEDAHVRFGKWPVQVLTGLDDLEGEAIRAAIAVQFEGVQTRVFSAEHLCALALQTGRLKDFARVKAFLDQGQVNRESLLALAGRYGLVERLRRVENEG